MNKTLFQSILLVIVLSCSGLCVYKAHRYSESKRNLAAAIADRDAILGRNTCGAEAGCGVSPKDLLSQTRDPGLVAAQTSVASEMPSARGSGSAATSAAQPVQPLASGIPTALKYEALNEVINEHLGDARGILNWNEETVTVFKQLLGEHLLQGSEIIAMARAHQLSLSSPDIAKLLDESRIRFLDKFKEHFGPQDYARFLSVWRTRTIAPFFNLVSGDFIHSGTPLSAEQSPKLLMGLAESSSSFRKGKDANTNNVDWDLLLTKTEPSLTKEQSENLRTRAIAFRASFEMFRMIRSTIRTDADATKQKPFSSKPATR